ncbi:lipopolysaccharide biosynthesis protein [Chitinophaga lutea]|uniref:Lipopolysaccharide biosynthesis protein n=1 Tax=Chitinophaga lutea TaxID=2488634 RepID=A0A3N4PWM9_9BACT|nr:lipopolysaccharide biosynthesis protein [Chitinophaga lutea]RPE13223.1 lipopolysaccharide biosynthesis protein [Chitinophaga lutea]
MKQSTANQNYSDDEISLKFLLLKIGEWCRFLLDKWKLILVISLGGAALGLFYAQTRETRYKGELTFILEETKSGGLGNYANLASQFGLELGGGSSSGLFTEDNIIGFLKSRFIVEKALLSPLEDDSKTTLADYYIKFNKLRERWKPELKVIQFPVNADRRQFSLTQDSILNILSLSLIRDHLQVTKPDKKTSFISIKCWSTNEGFSKMFVERLLKEATDFYVNTKTRRSRSNLEKLQQTADSIESLLNKRTYSTAALLDINKNPARNVASVGTEVAMREKGLLQVMYAEVIKNLEMARMTMMQETPVIQIIDAPILPLQKVKFGWIKGIVLGGAAGGFITIVFLLIRRILKEIME